MASFTADCTFTSGSEHRTGAYEPSSGTCLTISFFGGICLEQNLGPDRTRITKKIDAFMRLIRAI
jgi:hypothetical protein